MIDENIILGMSVPDANTYTGILDSSEFRLMEQYSNEFRVRNQDLFKRYGRSWVSDPLQQWSRRWEYLYVYMAINSYMKKCTAHNILDAGSGYTFFPHYLKNRFNDIEITCVDSDPTLAKLHNITAERYSSKMGFVCSDIRDLAIEGGKYDIIYCISVLEHTDDYVKILTELSRVASSTALLVLTFDVALSGLSDIPVHKAKSLLGDIARFFPEQLYGNGDMDAGISKSDVLSTALFIDNDKKLLPWKWPILNYIKDSARGKFRPTLYKRLTVFCGGFHRKET